MARPKVLYVCQSCGYQASAWLGRCPECGEWNTLVEELDKKSGGGAARQIGLSSGVAPRTMAAIDVQKSPRMATGIGEFDRVLGGGLVPGSLVLVGGDPGVGKSTLVLDAAMRISRAGQTVLYVSGEESAEQTKLRALRIGEASDSLYVLTETNLEVIVREVEKLSPAIVIIDSIQTMHNPELPTAAGSVGQVRECTARLLRMAKESGPSVLIIGHVTKEGAIAGPRLLEHMVDVGLQFEGDRSYAFRVLRAVKNRFGSTSESGIFSMEENGLIQVSNPAGLFLEEHKGAVPGAVVTACLEGTRPLLVEIQALVAATPFGMPRRTAVGFDYNRVTMLLAILEKRLGFALGNQDAYVNVVGGMKVTEPAADLAVVTALVSSFRDLAVPPHTLVLGEVGLTGEVRRVGAIARRVKEARTLGFTRFITPHSREPELAGLAGIVPVYSVTEALDAIWRQ